MATKISVFPGRKTRGSNYPWDEWADGSVWRVVRGVDFETSVDSFCSTVYKHGKKLNMGVRLTRDRDKEHVIFQFFKKGK